MVCWKPIIGYEGFYEISNRGKVRSIERYIQLKNGKKRFTSQRILREKDTGGYKFVALCKEGVRKDQYVHRLVAKAFIRNPLNLPIVNHIDGNKSNNIVENLEWLGHPENVQHAYTSNLNSNKGNTHSFSVGIIDNELGESFETIKEWANTRGLNYNTARNILNGYSKSATIDISRIEKNVKSAS